MATKTPANNNSRWMTRRELADELRVSVDTVDSLVQRGKLPKPIYLTPRLPRFDRLEVDAKLGIARKMDQSAIWDEAMYGTAAKARPARPKTARGRKL